MFSFFLFMFSSIYFWVSYSDFTCTASRPWQKSDSLQVGGPNCLSWLSSFSLRGIEFSIQLNSVKTTTQLSQRQRSPNPFVSALILNQDSLQSKYSGVSSNQNSSYPSPYSKAVGLFLLLFSFILKWKHCFYLKPYENWKCCMLFFLVEMKYFIIMGKRKYSHF